MSNQPDGTDPVLDGVTRALMHNDWKSPAVVSYVLIAEFMDDEGEKRLFSDTFEDQRGITTLGLLDYAHTVERRRVADAFMAPED